MALTKKDFYYGALLSRLMKTGSVPAIIESDESHRVYSLTNDNGEFNLYIKYSSKPSLSKNQKRWNFYFTDNEVITLKKSDLFEKDKYIFAFICGEENFIKSQIAFLTYDELRKAIGLEYQEQVRRLSVSLRRGSWNFLIYGTSLERTKNSIYVRRNVVSRLNELGFINEENAG